MTHCNELSESVIDFEEIVNDISYNSSVYSELIISDKLLIILIKLSLLMHLNELIELVYNIFITNTYDDGYYVLNIQWYISLPQNWTLILINSNVMTSDQISIN